MEHSIGFIGGGRVTKILLQGFINKNVKFDKVVVSDTNPCSWQLKELSKS